MPVPCLGTAGQARSHGWHKADPPSGAPSRCFLTYSCQRRGRYVMRRGISEKPRVTWPSHPTQLLQGHSNLLTSQFLRHLTSVKAQTMPLLGSELQGKLNLAKTLLGDSSLKRRLCMLGLQKISCSAETGSTRGSRQDKGHPLQTCLRSRNLLRASDGHWERILSASQSDDNTPKAEPAPRGREGSLMDPRNPTAWCFLCLLTNIPDKPASEIQVGLSPSQGNKPRVPTPPSRCSVHKSNTDFLKPLSP